MNMDELGIRLVKAADLVPDPENPRTHPEEQIEQLKGSIRTAVKPLPCFPHKNGGCHLWQPPANQ